MEILEFNKINHTDIKDIIHECNESLDNLYNNNIDDLHERSQYLKIKDSGNLALAILYMDDGRVKKYIAHSKFNEEESMHYLNEVSENFIPAHYYKVMHRTKYYETKVLDRRCSAKSKRWDRDVDTESKIIETIKNEFLPNQKGKLILWTKKYPCPSCRCVIDKFNQEYQGLEITILYSNRNLSNPCERGEGCAN